MSINSVSDPNQSYAQNGLSQMQTDFQQLGQALQSGNMGTAQQDYLAIQQLFGPKPDHSTGGLNSSNTAADSIGTVTAAGNNTVQSDFQQLGQALQSGNMGTAQQDYSNIQQLSQVIQAYQGHHHHHGGETSITGSEPVSGSSTASAQNPSTASSSSPSSDSNIIGQSIKAVISQYLSNSVAGSLGASGLLSTALGGININI